jgi:hypothetical protein
LPCFKLHYAAGLRIGLQLSNVDKRPGREDNLTNIEADQFNRDLRDRGGQ